jgi:hypothetical protein
MTLSHDPPGLFLCSWEVGDATFKYGTELSTKVSVRKFAPGPKG